MSSKYRVMFLRDKNGQPVGCIAIELTRSKKSAKYQISVLNPIDKFDRSLARQIALGRLVEAPFTAPLSLTIPDMHQISRDVMSHLSNNPEVPSRAARAGARWLKNNKATPAY